MNGLLGYPRAIWVAARTRARLRRMTEVERYLEAWRVHRRWWYASVGMFVGLIPFGILVEVLSVALGSEILPMLVVTAWLFGWAYTNYRVSTLLCPRCGKTFLRWRLSYNPFRSTCVHCGLARWSVRAEPLAPLE